MIFKKIYYYLFPGTVYEQEKRYIENFGYPENSVVFTDGQGRMSQIVGSKTFLETIKKFENSGIIKNKL